MSFIRSSEQLTWHDPHLWRLCWDWVSAEGAAQSVQHPVGRQAQWRWMEREWSQWEWWEQCQRWWVPLLRLMGEQWQMPSLAKTPGQV